MTTTNKPLTTTQAELLALALDTTDGRIETFPASLKGGARAKVLQALTARGLLREKNGRHTVTPAAYEALGRERTAKAAKATAPKEPAAQAKALREGTKLETIVQMLKRKSGATSAELEAATEWQPHSVRGFISGTLRKKMKLNVVAEKNDDKKMVYRIAA